MSKHFRPWKIDQAEAKATSGWWLSIALPRWPSMLGRARCWLGRQDSNLGMAESKTDVR
jgi:hypothetical protein